ncbi:MAG: DUF4157 domain-containing protein [Ginsengibacter sp.]
MHVSENKTTNSSQTTKNCIDRNPFFQPKLTVNEPGDEYEQEADRVADHIMRMPIDDQPFFKPMSPTISRLQRKCKDCEDEEKLQRKEKIIQRQPADQPSADLTISGDWEDQYHKTPNANNYQLNDAPLSFKSNRNKTNYADANLDLIGRGINNPDEFDKDYNSLWQTNLDFTRRQRLGTMYKNLRQKTLLGYVLPEPSKGMSDDVFVTNKMSLTALDSDTSGDHPAFNEGSGIIIPLKTFTKRFDENNLFKKDDTQHNDVNRWPDRNVCVEKYTNRLHASGKKLDKSTKNFFEPRIGYDLSDVKVHTDSEAAKSAESVNALAYTVGKNIVFNQNQFNPENDSGKKLLAHELTHVVQQSSGLHTKQIQRYAQCNPARLSLQDCPPRDSGEEKFAQNGEMVFLSFNDPISGVKAPLIANFDIKSSNVKANFKESLYWKEFIKKISSNNSRWVLLGFTDCQNIHDFNSNLRMQRAKAVFDILPADVQKQIDSYSGAPMDECIRDNTTLADRTLNRSVVFQFTGWDADIKKGENIQAKDEKSETLNCSVDERKLLALAYPIGKMMVENAIELITEMNPGSQEEHLLIKYFGKDAWAKRLTIRDGYIDLLHAWSRNPTMRCQGNNYISPGAENVMLHLIDKDNCGPGTEGFSDTAAVLRTGSILICDHAFALNDLPETIVHEFSHVYDWAYGDPQYCSRSSGCSLDTQRALHNADSYSAFAGEALDLWGPS